MEDLQDSNIGKKWSTDEDRMNARGYANYRKSKYLKDLSKPSKVEPISTNDLSIKQVNTTFNKLHTYLKDKNCPTAHDVVHHIVDYYIDNGMVCNDATIAGYARTYCLQHNLMDRQEYKKRIYSMM